MSTADFETGVSSPGVRWVLPTGTDRSLLIDITTLGDPYCKFLDPRTDKVINCAEYVAQMQAILELRDD